MTQQPVDAFAHFAGGLIGEGNSEDGVRSDALLADEPCDAAGDDAGLARACPGEDQQWAISGLDGGALFGIQVVGERLQRASPGGKVPVSSVPFRGLRAVCSPSSTNRVRWRFPGTRLLTRE